MRTEGGHRRLTQPVFFCLFSLSLLSQQRKRKGHWPLLRSIWYGLIVLDSWRHMKRDDYCMATEGGHRKWRQPAKKGFCLREELHHKSSPLLFSKLISRMSTITKDGRCIICLIHHTGQTYHPNLIREKKLLEISSEVYRCGGKTTKDQSYCPFGSTTFLTPAFLLSQSVLHFLSSDL